MVLLASAVPAAALCPGDCDRDGRVEVAELIVSVDIALGGRHVSNCYAIDQGSGGLSTGGFVSIRELIAAVLANLNGCDGCQPIPCPESLCGSPSFPNYPLCGGDCPPRSVCTWSDSSGICSCVEESRPCGDTAFACNGTCPEGQRCSLLGGSECVCADEERTLCGSDEDPICGGECPDGQECKVFGSKYANPYQGGPCVCSDAFCGSGGAHCAAAGEVCQLHSAFGGFACIFWPCRAADDGSEFECCTLTTSPGSASPGFFVEVVPGQFFVCPFPVSQLGFDFGL